ncbi:uncharacterized protein G2W53_003260 [Senna tora]|uniref:Uncharacterized protein n=1 Tax=Senna tora TaxID=362788 RepID=A0A835CJ42_9FABA|nr:uncharacterized protein G2W53_003260 [Senna tora]
MAHEAITTAASAVGREARSSARRRWETERSSVDQREGDSGRKLIGNLYKFRCGL